MVVRQHGSYLLLLESIDPTDARGPLHTKHGCLDPMRLKMGVASRFASPRFFLGCLLQRMVFVRRGKHIGRKPGHGALCQLEQISFVDGGGAPTSEIGLFLLTFHTCNAATGNTEQCNWQRFSFGKVAWFKEVESLAGSCVPKSAISHKHHFTSP